MTKLPLLDTPPPHQGWEFPPDEYRHRVNRARRLMAVSDMDCLILTSERNIRYFTGYHSQMWVNPGYPRYVLLPIQEEPIAIVPLLNVTAFRRLTWIADIRSWLAPQPADDGVSLVIDALRSLVKPGGRVGAEIGPVMRIAAPVADYLRIRDSLADIAFVDATPVLRPLRMVKSPSEVECLRRAAGIASEAFARFPALVAPGQTERDVYRIFRILLLELGAEEVPYVVPVSGRYGYEQITMGPTDRALQAGDLLMIDVGATWRGYFCDFDRNFALATATEEFERAHTQLFEATQAGMESIRPNRPVADVWRAMAAVLTPTSQPKSPTGRMGHGVGLDLAEPPSIVVTDDTVLEEGMVLTLEPSLALPEVERMAWRRMVHEEEVVVIPDGCDLLTRRVDATLPIVPI